MWVPHVCPPGVLQGGVAGRSRGDEGRASGQDPHAAAGRQPPQVNDHGADEDDGDEVRERTLFEMRH